MIGFCPLASGSRGNSIFFGTKKTKLLVDAGISGRATKTRLAELGIDVEEIDAILITHEHTDHIRGLVVLALKMKIPIFCNSDTAAGIVAFLGVTPQFKLFHTGETFQYRDLQIDPFSVQHDAIDPVAFTIDCEEAKVGFCADLGYTTTLVANKLMQCDYLYLEANHDPNMVYACSRPMIYKQRVLGRSGHLSNEECGQLLSQVVNDGLKHVYLAHLSGECNHPQRALECVGSFLKQRERAPTLSIAYQDRVSAPSFF
ncbi:MBL fold metallo-hydrolase [Simkania negevensis]|uniref:MBL fold metallo-hydrolase n=1 Tax=Simkania negevensis TaxID=83561 RepID=A0ABS3AVN1_9BACT|nr:MBL fold metallo-hydrolase [Simkania negevensis]